MKEKRKNKVNENKMTERLNLKAENRKKGK